MTTPQAAMPPRVQWWLAELDQHGNPTLIDGAHSERAGVDKAMALYNGLGFSPGRRFACARVDLTEAQPSNEDVNQDAMARCRTMIDHARTS